MVNTARNIAIICVYCIASNLSGSEYLPPADPSKPLYQWTGYPPPGNMWIGGKCHKVVIDAEAAKAQAEAAIKKAKAEMQLREMRDGWYIMIAGMLLASIGVAVHCMVKTPALQRITEGFVVLGGSSACAGLMLKKAAQYQNVIIVVVLAVIGVILMYRMRSKSIIEWMKKKKQKSFEKMENVGKRR